MATYRIIYNYDGSDHWTATLLPYSHPDEAREMLFELFAKEDRAIVGELGPMLYRFTQQTQGQTYYGLVSVRQEA